MSRLPKSYDETANNTKIEEQLETNSIVQDDYKKLKQENEYYRQELYILRLKLEASNALEKELQEINESLERSLAQRMAKAEEMFSEKEERYKITMKDYENHIADLEMDDVEKKREIMELHEELRKSTDFINKCSHCTTFTENTSSTQYEEKVEELVQLFQNEEKKRIALEEKLTDMENQYQEIKDILRVTKEQLLEKSEALQNTREELAMNRLELESLKVTPASDTCKGNSLFAEVEDRRQMLLDKMKALQCKYNDTKRMLNGKITEIDLLRAEKATMVKKWETDVIDTLQENANLFDKYKSRISDLENKLKAEIKSNKQTEEDVRSTDDSFNYAQSLLIMKKKELKQLKEQIEQQALQMLMQEEANHNISTQLRFWQTKAMSMKAQILSIKAQLQTERTKDDNKSLLEAIENCKITDITDFEKTCDNLRITSDNFMLKNDTYQENSTRISEKSTVDRYANEQKQVDGKVLRFVTDTKNIEKQSLKKQSKQHKYPIVSITDEL